MEQAYDLAFLHEWGVQQERGVRAEERALLRHVNELVREADVVVVRLGGKAGRLGESIVATSLLEGILLALQYLGKAGIAVEVIIDEGVSTLFKEQLYQQAYWPTITFSEAMSGEDIFTRRLERARGAVALGIDLHGGHDGMPELMEQAVEEHGATRRIATLARLFRVGVRSYAGHGVERRYADFIENLLQLPRGALPGEQVQPRIRLGAADEARYTRLARKLHLQDEALRIVCFFQSVVIAKCYCRWDEVLEHFSREEARRSPGQKIEFLILCGPDELHPEGLRVADMQKDFGTFRGTNNNANVLVYATETLRDLALLTQHAYIVFSNDTGPGHIAGALQIPTITPYLPGTIYSMAIWASSPWHRGVTLEPNPFSYQQVEAAILWDRTTIIDSIPPEKLVQAALQ
ncbi:glycosyltransferase family 9 protein [Ktedonobacter robiniae]|uniref:Glycosyltransferase family 9 protein n=1 Tax=Ktedonobacter robiniae TaxID=2778365 RepID=A0ABQ3UK23_9CHLR|nr:glycosyltransferase family 9 protein [Ktedonobacter robiniae]GHO53033.1 hypothetical protein KSB_15080 [Ktedonobacter robiniae]